MPPESPRIAPSAVVEEGATVGDRSVVWDLTQIRAGARIGAECVIGRNVFVDADVQVGDRCKIQNNALVYAPATLAEGVFLGPAVVLTNDRNPRAVDVAGNLKSASGWDAAGVTIERGASVGAGSVVVAGVTIGRWALVAANSTVVRDAPAFSLVGGAPARHLGWVGPAGHRLTRVDDTTWRCPMTGQQFEQIEECMLREEP